MIDNKRIKKLVNWLLSEEIIRSHQELGEIMGISNKSYLSQLINGRAYNVNFINKFSEIDPRINIDWLLTGEGEMLKTNITGNKNQVMFGDNHGTLFQNASVGSVHSIGNNGDAVALQMEIDKLNLALAEKDKQLAEKERIIEEKERLITVLMNK